MTKVDAIRKVMEKNGGFASWNYIYDNIEKYYPAIKSTEDWQEGIRGVLYREIKTNKNFKRISLGTFALQEYKQKKQLPEIIKGNIRMHSYIEGLMVELGNYEKFDTFCLMIRLFTQDLSTTKSMSFFRKLSPSLLKVFFQTNFPFGGVK